MARATFLLFGLKMVGKVSVIKSVHSFTGWGMQWGISLAFLSTLRACARGTFLDAKLFPPFSMTGFP